MALIDSSDNVCELQKSGLGQEKKEEAEKSRSREELKEIIFKNQNEMLGFLNKNHVKRRSIFKVGFEFILKFSV